MKAGHQHACPERRCLRAHEERRGGGDGPETENNGVSPLLPRYEDIAELRTAQRHFELEGEQRRRCRSQQRHRSDPGDKERRRRPASFADGEGDKAGERRDAAALVDVKPIVIREESRRQPLELRQRGRRAGGALHRRLQIV